jgi:hypothetical protein
MSATAISGVGAAALAAVSAWLGYIFGVRQERDKERRARNFTAAAELVGPLRELQRLLRRFGREEVAKNEVTDAFTSWANAYDNHGHRLPREWHHLSRSVRDAAGTVFGGVSLVHIRPDAAQLELAEPDGMWQDFADEYLDYAARWVLEWGDASREAPKGLMTYQAWLVRTERCAPDGTSA